jgi:hypothetical protein
LEEGEGSAVDVEMMVSFPLGNGIIEKFCGGGRNQVPLRLAMKQKNGRGF